MSALSRHKLRAKVGQQTPNKRAGSARMTALLEYQRLEAPGLWRENATAQRRDVIVSFGDASLVISDKHDQAITHWSLAAVRRLNPGQRPALYSPGSDSEEELEVEDATMIEAIGRVMAAIARARPHPGRLRFWLLSGSLAAVIAAMVFWMPAALRTHATRVVPMTVRQDIGQQMLDAIGRMSGSSCTGLAGMAAMSRLTQRVLGNDGGRVVVVPGGVAGSAHLPGRLILLNRAIVEDPEDPDVVAGYLLYEDERRAAADPLAALLRHAGPLASFRLLTTGTLKPETIRAYAETLLIAPAEAPDTEALLARFETAGIPSSPYAFALDPSGETVLPLIEGDPMRGKDSRPVLADADWIRLQSICGS